MAGRFVEQLLIARITIGAGDSSGGIDFNRLSKANLVERRGVRFIEPFEFDGGEFGEGELAGLIVAVNAVVVRFDFLVIAQKGALGGGVIAGERGEAFVVLRGPEVGVAGELPFDLFEALSVALELPVRERELFDQAEGGLGVGAVVIEPGLEGGFKFGGIFVGQHGFLGAAAVLEGVLAGFRFAFGAARTGRTGAVLGRELVDE